MHLLLLRKRIEAGFGKDGGERIAGHQHFVVFPKKGNVPERVPRRVHPAPAGQTGHAAISGQGGYAGAKIVGVPGVSERQVGHQAAAHGGVGRRVAGAAGEVGQF